MSGSPADNAYRPPAAHPAAADAPPASALSPGAAPPSAPPRRWWKLAAFLLLAVVALVLAWQLRDQFRLENLVRHKQRIVELRAEQPVLVYGAAFVSYEKGSPLTYYELLVARPIATDEHGRRVTITDIWVDSPASVAGGRELWAIPKGLCDFALETSHTGPITTTEWTARLDRTPIATARFRDVSRAAPRLPFKGGTWQPGIEDTVSDVTRHLLGTNQHAVDFRIVDGGEVRSRVDPDDITCALKELQRGILQRSLGNAEFQLHRPASGCC